jgi:hypothetical protein
MKRISLTLIFVISLLSLALHSQANEIREKKFTIDLSDTWLRSSDSVLGEVTYKSVSTRESISVFVFQIEKDKVASANEPQFIEKMVRAEHSKARNQMIDPASAIVSVPTFSSNRGHYTIFSPAENSRTLMMWSVNGLNLSLFTHKAIGMKESEFSSRAQSIFAKLKVDTQ